MLDKTISTMANLYSADDDTTNRTRPSCWLEVVNVVDDGGGTGGVLEEAEGDGATLVGAVRPDVVHNLRAVLVIDLVLRTVKVRLEVEPIFHARFRGVRVVDAVGAAGVVVVAGVAVGLLEEVASHGKITTMPPCCSIVRSSLGRDNDQHTIVAPMGVKTQVGVMAAGALCCWS